MPSVNRRFGIQQLGLAGMTLLGSACGGSNVPEAVELEVVLHAESGSLPPSRTHSIALIAENRACVLLAYEKQVACGDPSWTDVATFGKEGSAPGEFRSPVRLVRGPAETVGVVDYQTLRFTVFSSRGKLLHTVATPPIFQPIGMFDDSLVLGSYMSPGSRDSLLSAPLAWISIRQNEIIRKETWSHRSATTRGETPGATFSHGARAPNGEVVFRVADYVLARYSPDGRLIHEFQPPSFQPELPNGRDIEAIREDLRYIFASTPSEQQMSTLLSRPKNPLIAGVPMAFDEVGRLWVPTSRNRDQHSYLDVYRDARLLTSIRVRDRLLAFDILGNQLVALVERGTPDPNGIRTRAIDWYLIPSGE